MSEAAFTPDCLGDAAHSPSIDVGSNVSSAPSFASSADKPLRDASDAQVRGDGGLVVLDRVGEKESAGRGEIAEALRARLE